MIIIQTRLIIVIIGNEITHCGLNRTVQENSDNRAVNERIKKYASFSAMLTNSRLKKDFLIIVCFVCCDLAFLISRFNLAKVFMVNHHLPSV